MAKRRRKIKKDKKKVLGHSKQCSENKKKIADLKKEIKKAPDSIIGDAWAKPISPPTQLSGTHGLNHTCNIKVI